MMTDSNGGLVSFTHLPCRDNNPPKRLNALAYLGFTLIALGHETLRTQVKDSSQSAIASST